jgi:hypothetical protein
MSPDERRYRVTAQLKSVYQIVIEAQSPEEAKYFAADIDMEKWTYVEGDYEVIDVSKDYFLKRLKDQM